MSQRQQTVVTFSVSMTLQPGQTAGAALDMLRSVIERAGGRSPDDPSTFIGPKVTIKLVKKEISYGR